MKNRLYLSMVIVAALCLAGWTVKAQLQRSNSARQSWDYKVIEVYNEPRGGEVRWLWQEDGKQLPGSPAILSKAKELGEQGWELVSESSAGAPIRYTYWFKHPK